MIINGAGIRQSWRVKNEFQDREYVLKWFGQKEGEALKAYCQFMEHGIPLGRRPELVGGDWFGPWEGGRL